MTNKPLTLGSLFDGSGGFPLGGLLAGITPVWASETEPFPIRVTTRRLPFMKHYGDISRMDGGRIEPVDIITFGSPCQDMSIAGRRSGLDGTRSSLFYEAIRIIKEMRCATGGRYPRYIVWENVPGVFSSNGGEDFHCVLAEVCSIKDATVSLPGPERWQYAGEILGDGYSVAWRVLDAQYWGVPQRRRRIFLVADLTDGGAGKILFASEGVSGYTPQSVRAWQGTSGGAEKGACPTVAGTLTARYDSSPCVDRGQTIVVAAEAPYTMKIRAECECGGKGALLQTDKSGTLSCNNDQTLFAPKAYGICAKDSNAMKSDNPYSGIYEAETARTLDGNSGNPSCNQGGITVVGSYSIQGSMIGRDNKNGPQGDGVNEDVSFTLNTVDRHAVYAMTTGGFTQVSKDLSPTVMARDYKDPNIVCPDAGYTVRRLTPLECARLQGFPDWWCDSLGTEHPTDEDMRFWRGVFKTYSEVAGGRMKSDKQIEKWLRDPYSDAAAYTMWGNGVALPCVQFVLSGIVWYSQSCDADSPV